MCDVSYPWIPTQCSHCKKLGHNIIYCPKATLQWVPAVKSTISAAKADQTPQASTVTGKEKASDVHSDVLPTPQKNSIQDTSCSIPIVQNPADNPLNVGYPVHVAVVQCQFPSTAGFLSHLDGSPMIIDQPDTILALPATLHPTKKVQDFINAGQFSQKTINQSSSTLTSTPSFESTNPFTVLSTTKKPIGTLSLSSKPSILAPSLTNSLSATVSLPAIEAPLITWVASPKHL